MKFLFLFCLILFLCACSPSDNSSAVIQLDETNEVTISNPNFSLTVYQISKIDSKELGDRTVSLKKEFLETYTLYEIRTRYTNLGDKESKLSYWNLILTLPEIEEPENELFCTGYCEQDVADPSGVASSCAYQPSQQSGKYTYKVIMMKTKKPLPGEQAELFLYCIIENTLSQVQISFVEPKEETGE